MKVLLATALSATLIVSFIPSAVAAPDEPRYCAALIDALAAAPDSSLYPMNTKKKRRLVDAAQREQNKLFKRAQLIAQVDRDLVVARGLANRLFRVGDMAGYKLYVAGDAQARRDCGIGFL